MRKFLLLVLLFVLCFSVVAQEYSIQGYVNDYADVLSSEHEVQIQSLVEQLHRSNTAEIAVVTIPSLEGRPIETVAFEMAEGVLGDANLNNGLLLLISIEDRKYRFEVGRGLEGSLNDAKIGRIGRGQLVPAFQQEQYAQGILSALNDVKTILTTDQDPTTTYSTLDNSSSFWIYFIFVFIFVVLIPLINFVFFFRKRRKKGDDYFLAAIMAASMMNSGRRGGGSSSFGGFGGGSFGGGGAGGSW